MYKVLTIFLLVIALLLPLGLIYGVVADRQDRSLWVKNEMAHSWGDKQTIAGPLLVIPYVYNGHNSYAYVMPSDYKSEHQLKPEEHYRGIFKNIACSDKPAFVSYGSHARQRYFYYGIKNYFYNTKNRFRRLYPKPREI